MTRKVDSRVEKGAELASQIMDKLQIIFAVLLAVAFAAAVAGLATNLFLNLVSIPGPSKIMAFLSAALMVSLIGSMANQFIEEAGEFRPHMIVSVAVVGSAVGVLEDWLAPASASNTPESQISLAFSLVILALLVALVGTSIERD